MARQRHMMVDGKSTFFLDQYPEQAWTQLAPSSAQLADSRQATMAAGNYYQVVAYLYRCVNIRATAATRVPWAIMQGDNEVWRSTVPSPPPALSYLQNFKRLLSLTEAALCLAPEAFWFIERNRAKIIALRWHAPNSVVPQFSEQSGLTGFKRILDRGRSQTFEPTDYVYLPLPNPLHETIPGRPPAQAALSSAGVLYNIDQFASNFFERGGIKATLLTVDGNPLPAEMERLESWWKRFFSGSKSAWETAAVRAGVTPVVVGEGMENLATAELSEERRQDIATALGVPHSIVMSNAANYATAQQDALSFYDMTIIPSLTHLAEIVNESLLAPSGYRLELRPEEMSIYQADEERRSNSMLNYVQAGIKPSVAAEILGVSLPYGIEYKDLDPAPVAPAPVAPAPAPEQAPAIDTAKSAEIARFRRWAKKRHNPDPALFASDILTPVDKASLLEAVDGTGFFTPASTGQTSRNSIRDKALVLQGDPGEPEEPVFRPIEIAEPRKRDRLEREVTSDIQSALTKQQRAIYETARTMSAEEFIGDVSAELEASVRKIQEEQALYDRLRRALLESVDLGVFVAVEQLESIGLGVDWTLVNEDARAWAQNHIGTLIGGIDETTLARTRTAVAAWIQNGEPLYMLIEDLEPVFGSQRAQLIASTEVTRAYAEANQRVYKEAGIRYMEWRAAADELMCPICGALNGQIVGIDDKFDQALDEEIRTQFRSNFQLPPAHPRCRCWIVPVVVDTEV